MEGTPFGRYQLIESLGRGAMGETWRAYDTRTSRPVGLKILAAHRSRDRAFNGRFLRNMPLIARLGNPHMIPIHDFGEIGGSLYVDMQLIEGHDLGTVLAEERLLHPAHAVHYIEQVADALDEIHSQGLLHLAIKPSNILITTRDFVYLSYLYEEHNAVEPLTKTGPAPLGYTAPECFTDAAYDRCADIYAMACVLHEALTGQRPFAGDTLEQQISAHLMAPPPRPTTLQPGVPELLDDVIATGMAKDPEQRYSTIKQLAQAARAALITTA